MTMGNTDSAMPIGNRQDESKQYNVAVIDLDREIEFLEDTGIRKDEITAMCVKCGDTVTQLQNTCGSCGIPTVWRHSIIWKRNFGNPETFLKSLTEPDTLPKTALEVKAVERFGTNRKFSNISQAREFRTLQGKYPAGYILDMMTWARAKRVGFHNFVKAVRNSDNMNTWNARQEEVVDDSEEERDPNEGWANR